MLLKVEKYILTFLSLTLLAIIILIFCKQVLIKNQTKSNLKKFLNDYSIKCEKLELTTEDFEKYSIDNLYINQNRLMNSITTEKIIYFDKKKYNKDKKNLKYKNYILDDENLTIEYQVGDPIYYIEDQYGNEFNFEYKKYVKFSEENGYTCNI